MIGEPHSELDSSFGETYALEQLRRAKHPVRRLLKKLYVSRLLRKVSGATLDYGCGAGQLLARLPPGSLGLESNPTLVAALQFAGLPVRQWTHREDGFDLPGLETHGFETLVISHVLEHLCNPCDAFRRLLIASRELGVKRVLVVVPGERGYKSDQTHKTFIDMDWIVGQGWRSFDHFKMTAHEFFPLPWEAAGRLFIYNELHLTFDIDESVRP